MAVFNFIGKKLMDLDIEKIRRGALNLPSGTVQLQDLEILPK